MIRRAIQGAIKKLGYRLVAKERDAWSLHRCLENQKFQSVLDVGAATGMTVLQWTRTFPDATIHAFEPVPSAYEELHRVSSMVGPRANAWNYAIGDIDDEAWMHVFPGHLTASSLLSRTEHCLRIAPGTAVEAATRVRVRRLDTFIDTVPPLRRPALLKMDVQGYEDRVVKGAATTLGQIDFIVSEVSIAQVYQGQCSFSTLHSLLGERGFELFGFLEQTHSADGDPVYVDVVYKRL